MNNNFANVTPWGSVHFLDDGRVILVRAAHESGLILHIELTADEVQAICNGRENLTGVA